MPSGAVCDRTPRASCGCCCCCCCSFCCLGEAALLFLGPLEGASRLAPSAEAVAPERGVLRGSAASAASGRPSEKASGPSDVGSGGVIGGESEASLALNDPAVLFVDMLNDPLLKDVNMGGSSPAAAIDTSEEYAVGQSSSSSSPSSTSPKTRSTAATQSEMAPWPGSVCARVDPSPFCTRWPRLRLLRPWLLAWIEEVGLPSKPLPMLSAKWRPNEDRKPSGRKDSRSPVGNEWMLAVLSPLEVRRVLSGRSPAGPRTLQFPPELSGRSSPGPRALQLPPEVRKSRSGRSPPGALKAPEARELEPEELPSALPLHEPRRSVPEARKLSWRWALPADSSSTPLRVTARPRGAMVAIVFDLLGSRADKGAEKEPPERGGSGASCVCGLLDSS
mmetsp:Transcript_41366/g.110267  ORF Transcript_41366/g.110267 Transcript_41366/m.110267 type:complete len:391 (+) Transcript_41366:278-1450(+)